MNRQSHHYGWMLGFSVCPWHKTAEHTSGCQNQKLRQSWFTSLTAKEWCIKSLPHLLRLSTKSSISKLWNVWDRGLIIWSQNCSLTSGSCTMTTCPCTQYSPGVFGGKIDHRIPLTYQVLLHVTPFSVIKNHFKGSHFDTAEGRHQKVMMAF